MSTRKWEKTDKKGRTEEWSWEESPEVIQAIAVYRATVAANKVRLAEL
tara:strand:- start:743 stop:886 length:144 start_codon:yes stop_codon:yes gene_type:complete